MSEFDPRPPGSSLRFSAWKSRWDCWARESPSGARYASALQSAHSPLALTPGPGSTSECDEVSPCDMLAPPSDRRACPCSERSPDSAVWSSVFGIVYAIRYSVRYFRYIFSVRLRVGATRAQRCFRHHGPRGPSPLVGIGYNTHTHV